MVHGLDYLWAFLLASFAYSFSTILHEMAHLIMCRWLKCRVISMKALFIKYDGSRYYCGFVGKNHCAFATKSKEKMKKIVIAGPMTELFLALCFCLLSQLFSIQWIKYGLLGGSILIFLSVVYNLLPMTNGDGKMLYGKEHE